MTRVKLIGAVLVLAAFGGVACTDHDSDVVSENLSTAADQFQIARRIVFYNGITGDYMLEIQGLCALGNQDSARELTVTCKVGEGQYKKHFLGLSDNVTFFVEQVEAETVSAYHYDVVFKPSVIVPHVETGAGT